MPLRKLALTGPNLYFIALFASELDIFPFPEAPAILFLDPILFSRLQEVRK